MSQDVVLELRGVERTYSGHGGEVPAVCGVDLVLRRGEFVSLVGPSGCGKSTLLNILGCLDRPTAGQVILRDRDVSQFSSNQLARVRNREIGFVFQSYNLLRRMSALKNVELPMVYGGVPRAERAARAREQLARVHLEHRLDHTPNQMSGGECQRVAIARALVMNPDLVLADEPTGNLDTRTGADIMGIFHRLHGEGITLLMVTHSPEMAEQATRIVRMLDGRIVA
ncbi:MAG: macrolide ABC transporter ATP-binding protein [Candidatus Xenobia bacterium]